MDKLLDKFLQENPQFDPLREYVGWLTLEQLKSFSQKEITSNLPPQLKLLGVLLYKTLHSKDQIIDNVKRNENVIPYKLEVCYSMKQRLYDDIYDRCIVANSAIYFRTNIFQTTYFHFLVGKAALKPTTEPTRNSQMSFA